MNKEHPLCEKQQKTRPPQDLTIQRNQGGM